MRDRPSTVRRTALAVVVLAAACLPGCLTGSGPAARFAASPTSGLPPLEVQFDARASSSPHGAILTYDWTFDNGTHDNGAMPIHTFLEKGVHTVSLTVTDAAGNTASSQALITVTNLAPHAVFAVDPAISTKTIPVAFDADASFDPDGEIVDWRWSFGDGDVGYGQRIDHLYEAYGSYTVRLTVVDDTGEEATTEREVRIVGCGKC